MTGNDLLPVTVLKRKAVVYVRQSTPGQVQNNLESQRRQYELVDVARRWGFHDVEVIDDDLGRTASGTVDRPGFERLVSGLCTGKVGAVLCLDASRLSRNGRDWHHLLELCGLVEARVIDLDGVYDPCRPNDRLLLGMKGSISEFELGILRTRMLDAARAKARRGELRLSVPIGYIWHREYGLGLDPDIRVQEAIRLIFSRFRELGSARQVLISLTADNFHFPRPSDGRKTVSFDWVPVRYRSVISILKNPFYAGVYVYGKSEKRTEIVDGRARKSYGHSKPFGTWEVLLQDHHEGYIDWSEFETNQSHIAVNAFGQKGGIKSGRGGRALLAGLLTCGRCGRRLGVVYSGRPPGHPYYRCERINQMLAKPRCMTFGASRIDPAIGKEILRAVTPMAIEAAMEADRAHRDNLEERHRMVELDLQQARYEASLAERRYAEPAAAGLDRRSVPCAELYRGIPRAIVCDNLKSGVVKALWFEPTLSATFAAMAEHYDTTILPTRSRRPRDKGKVEGAVLIVERWILARLRNRRFFSLADLNSAIADLLVDLNDRPMRHVGKSRRAIFEEIERTALAALPTSVFEYAEWKTARVHPDYHIEADKTFYSVPHRLIGRQVDVRLTHRVVEIFYDHVRVASHMRTSQRRGHVTVNEHMPKSHQRYANISPASLIERARKTGPNTAMFVERLMVDKPHPEQGYRSAMGILSLARRYEHDRLEAACDRALVIGAVTYSSVNAILKAGLDKIQPTTGPLKPTPTHGNIRGGSYYQ